MNDSYEAGYNDAYNGVVFSPTELLEFSDEYINGYEDACLDMSSQ